MQRYVEVDSRLHPVHRLVWIYHNGNDVPKKLACKAGNYADCRIENIVANPQAISIEQARKNRRQYHENYKVTKTPEEWGAIMRNNNLRKSYGITMEDYAVMLAAQNGACAVCLLPETMIRHGRTELLSVDHCHESKKVRGLLCTNCNNALGRFKDDPARLRRAADYIERHQLPFTGGAG